MYVITLFVRVLMYLSSQSRYLVPGTTQSVICWVIFHVRTAPRLLY
jgi:hypothetical protein